MRPSSRVRPWPPSAGRLLALFLLLLAATGRLAGQTAADAQGRIVAAQGRVEHTEARRELWTNARLFQPLYVDERVRTVRASRAAVLFVDETQVKLNANAVLTVRQVRAPGAPAPTIFDLLEGEAWFRTKNPASGVMVTTPSAATTIRGTEINVAIGPSNETVLTVVEGTAELANAAGSILVFAGEEGTAQPGQAPTKQVVLNPEDAVQWVLYYPVGIPAGDLPEASTVGDAEAGYASLRAGDPAGALQAFGATPAGVWGQIGASIAQLALGRADDAIAAVTIGPEGLAPDAAVARYAQLAAAHLGAGDADAARAELEAALAVDPDAARPLALLSSLELRQNDTAGARAAAARAVAARPGSIAARIAASEAAQAAFDLAEAERQLDVALELDPRDVRALVDRARIRFGRGDTAGARRDAEAAAAVAPDAGPVRSLAGFIRLAEGDVDDATTEFQAAIQADPQIGEPHLGLGLVYFRAGRINDGLLEMLTATLLEPKVSLYQSYLGKAYYQIGRFPEGLSALATAKRLDPRDPTPWLYTSFFLRDQNQQVDALAELRRAIALNDNRAVYRSRLLLDRDLATKNVSLAELYRQLGFEAWGAYEALRSLEADATNASAHLFMAETYGNLPDRTQALSSELLQYFLNAPVNRNSFNNFAEYTALLETPRRQVLTTARAGSDRHAFGNLVLFTGNERFSHTSFIDAESRDGFRPGVRDHRVQAFGQGKVAFNASTDLFFTASGVRDEAGARDTLVDVISGPEGPVLVERYDPVPDPHEANRNTSFEAAAGFRHAWGPGSALTAAARVTDLEFVRTVDAPFGLCVLLGIADCPIRTINRVTTPIRSYEYQAQQVTRLGPQQIVAGAEVYRQRQESRQYLATTVDGRPDFEFEQVEPAEDRGAALIFRDEIRAGSRLHLTGGVHYQRFDFTDRLTGLIRRQRRWQPIAGAALRLTPKTVIRAAAFRNLNAAFIGARISPTTVAGFVVERNELPTAERSEAALAVEHAGARFFAGGHVFVRDVDAPAFDPATSPDADATTRGGGAFLNLIVSSRVSVFADDVVSVLQARAFDRWDHVARVGATFIHPRGLFARAHVSFLHQEFTSPGVPGLPPSDVALVDAEISYEFAAKRGLATLEVTNLFDTAFTNVIELTTIDVWRPRRRVLASLRWRLW